MQTFLFVASTLSLDHVRSVLRRAEGILGELMPQPEGFETVSRGFEIPEVPAGWHIRSPDDPYLTESIDPDLALLAWGKLYADDGRNSRPLASHLARTFRAAGTDGIRALDGDFSAIIVDRTSHAVHIVHDEGGRRTLRFTRSNGYLCVAPHDATLVATGLVSIEADLVSPASTLVFDWSLRGQSFLSDIETAHPAEAVVWKAGQLDRKMVSKIVPTKRIPVEDRGAFERRRARMVDNLLRNVAAFCGRFEEIDVDLTAGMDTRATLGLALQTTEHHKLRVRCAGGPASREVRTARRVMRQLRKVRFESYEPEEALDIDMAAHLSLLAFCMNGDTNGKRAVGPMPLWRSEPPRLNGNGGGLFKGIYYRDLHRKDAATLRPGAARDQLVHLFGPRIMHLPFVSPELGRQVELRARETMESYEEISSHGADHLDLFQYWERIGRFGSPKSRLPWTDPTFSPFDSCELARLAFGWAPPITHDYALHRELIRRFLPSAYWIPINHQRWLPLSGPGRRHQVGRWLLAPTLLPHLVSEGWTRLSGAPNWRSHEEKRSVAVRNQLDRGLEEALLRSDGISTSLLRRAQIEGWIRAQRSGKNRTSVLGKLAVFEAYWDLVKEIERRTRKLSD